MDPYIEAQKRIDSGVWKALDTSLPEDIVLECRRLMDVSLMETRKNIQELKKCLTLQKKVDVLKDEIRYLNG